MAPSQSSAPATSAHHGRVPRPPRPRRGLRRHRRREGRAAQRRASPDPRGRASRTSSREGCDRAPRASWLGAANAVADAEFVYLCVPTPQGDDGSADLSYIEAAAREIGPLLPPEAVVVNKSTVPGRLDPGRSSRRSAAPTSCVVSNPEFLREGSAVARLPATRPRRDRRRRPGRRHPRRRRCTSASPRRSSSPTRRRPR